MSISLSFSLHPSTVPKLHSPTKQPISATLSFEKSNYSLSHDPSVDYVTDLAAIKEKIGGVNTKVSGSLVSDGAQQDSVIKPRGRQRFIDDDQSLSLPALLPPSQLSLFELLRHDIESAPHPPAAVCNAADTLITSVLSPAQLDPSVDPALQLTGNCAPVAETPPTPCSIKGILPPGLEGVYLRNGPNATHLHRGEGYHLFDGNGMLHSVKLEDGRAIFCARYVRTARYVQEVEAGRPLFPKFFGGLSGVSGMARTAVVFLRAAFGLVKVSKGWGLSNTSVGFFNGQVLSLSEDDMPYAIRVTESGDLLTLGHFKLPGKSNMCAHPKFDTFTGEMFGFSFNPPSLPPFSLFRVSADGVKSPDVPVPLFDMPLVHDFAITRRYVVFPDNQLVMRPLELLKGGSVIVSDAGKTPRFCLLPRYALAEEAAQKAQWFDVPGCNCLHYINAWEEGPDEVVLVTPVLAPPELILEMPAVNISCTLSEIRMNTATGTARHRKICVGNFEFGTLNQKFVGQKSRYVYLASGCYPQLTGVVKVDLQADAEAGEEAIVGRREYGEGCTGGEPFFVAREGKQMGEDDGYLLCYVHNEKRRVSELLIMDALSPTLRVIASVQLPSRVPSGFHGWFVTQKQLSMQA